MGTCCASSVQTQPTESSITHHTQSIHLAIFKSDQIGQCIDCPHYKQCPSISRLCVALRYYSELNPVNNPQQQDIFAHFTTTIYTNLLDDYIHFIKQHQHQIQEIKKEFIDNRGFTKCNIKTCPYTSRHHRVDQKILNDNNSEENSSFDFFKETMDSLHYYIFHIFDSGLRTQTTPTTDDINDEKKSIARNDDEFFDSKFAELRQRINDKRENTKTFERFERHGNNSKFSINIQNNDDDTVDSQQTNTIQREYGFTFLDSIFKHLKKINIDNDTVNNLKKFL